MARCSRRHTRSGTACYEIKSIIVIWYAACRSGATKALSSPEDPLDDGRDLLPVGGVQQLPRRIERIGCAGQSEWRRRDPALQVEQQRHQVALRAQPAQRAGRGAEHADHLAAARTEVVAPDRVAADRAGN